MAGERKMIGVVGKWVTNNNTITITIKEAKTDKIKVGQTTKISFKIEGDELLFLDGSGRKVNRLKRIK